jgi:hypothetical protein
MPRVTGSLFWTTRQSSHSRVWLTLVIIIKTQWRPKPTGLHFNGILLPRTKMWRMVAWRHLRALRFHHYKVSVVQKLIPADPTESINFVVRSYNLSTMELPSQRFFHWAMKLWFIGFVNAHNTRHWDTSNSHTNHEIQCNEQDVGVWCAVNGRRKIELFFMTR